MNNPALSMSTSVEQAREDDLHLAVNGDPVRYLEIFLQIMRRKDRYQIAFNLKTLGWMEKVWTEASIVAKNDPRVAHERERYKHLGKKLASEMLERRESGFMFLNEPGDWPTRGTVMTAINALKHAEIYGIQ